MSGRLFDQNLPNGSFRVAPEASAEMADHAAALEDAFPKPSAASLKNIIFPSASSKASSVAHESTYDFGGTFGSGPLLENANYIADLEGSFYKSLSGSLENNFDSASSRRASSVARENAYHFSPIFDSRPSHEIADYIPDWIFWDSFYESPNGSLENNIDSATSSRASSIACDSPHLFNHSRRALLSSGSNSSSDSPPIVLKPKPTFKLSCHTCSDVSAHCSSDSNDAFEYPGTQRPHWEPPVLDYRKFEEGGSMYHSLHRHPDTKPEQWYEYTDAEIEVELLGDYHTLISSRKRQAEGTDDETRDFYEGLEREIRNDRVEMQDKLGDIQDRLYREKQERKRSDRRDGHRAQEQFDRKRKAWRLVDSEESEWDEQEWEMFAKETTDETTHDGLTEENLETLSQQLQDVPTAQRVYLYVHGRKSPHALLPLPQLEPNPLNELFDDEDSYQSPPYSSHGHDTQFPSSDPNPAGLIHQTNISADDIEQYISDPDPTDRKYSCLYPNCAKRFGRKDNIKSHVLTHFPERQFECPHCSRSFARQHHLKRHVILHSIPMPWDCDCGRFFAGRDALMGHRQHGWCLGAPEKRGKKVLRSRGNLGQLDGASDPAKQPSELSELQREFNSGVAAVARKKGEAGLANLPEKEYMAEPSDVEARVQFTAGAHENANFTPSAPPQPAPQIRKHRQSWTDYLGIGRLIDNDEAAAPAEKRERADDEDAKSNYDSQVRLYMGF